MCVLSIFREYRSNCVSDQTPTWGTCLFNSRLSYPPKPQTQDAQPPTQTNFAPMQNATIVPYWTKVAIASVPLSFNLYLSLLIYDLQSKNWINTYYMLTGFLKARRPPKVSNEMKCINEKMTWNTQDTNLSWYVPKANVDHTIRGQGTAITTLDHSATTPRASIDIVSS